MGYGSAERDFLEEVFFLLEEVIIFGGGRFCWRRCIFWNLEEVFFVGGGDVCFWSRVALTGHRTSVILALFHSCGITPSATDLR